MYICPICNRQFEKEEYIAKHTLTCWREQNPFHHSKPAPHSDDVVTHEINSDIQQFFAGFARKDKK